MGALMAVMVPVGVPGASAILIVPAEYWVDINSGVNDSSHGTESAPFKTITYAASVAGSADTIEGPAFWIGQ
jgi:hypothetical protein